MTGGKIDSRDLTTNEISTLHNGNTMFTKEINFSAVTTKKVIHEIDLLAVSVASKSCKLPIYNCIFFKE